MKKTMLVALAIALGAGANVALAEGSPELNRPFGSPGYYSAPPSVAVVPGPVASDADAYARLQADGDQLNEMREIHLESLPRGRAKREGGVPALDTATAETGSPHGADVMTHRPRTSRWRGSV